MIKITPTKFFEKELKELYKKYKNIPKDMEILKDELIQNPTIGKSLGHNCYKVRVKNSDNNKGKSGGYRVITYFVHNEEIFLLSIYQKGEQESISIEKILYIIKENLF